MPVILLRATAVRHKIGAVRHTPSAVSSSIRKVTMSLPAMRGFELCWWGAPNDGGTRESSNVFVAQCIAAVTDICR